MHKICMIFILLISSAVNPVYFMNILEIYLAQGRINAALIDN